METAYAHSPAEGLDWSHAHGLREHLEAVATLAQDHARSLGAPEWGYLAGLWHDLGKYRHGFQRYLRGEPLSGHEKSHKLAGAAHALTLDDRVAAPVIALCIAGHHGGLPRFRGQDSIEVLLPQARVELSQALAHGAPPEILARRASKPPPGFADARRRLRSEDITVYLELLTRMLFSALVDADYLDTSRFYDPDGERRRAELCARQTDIATLRRRLDDHLDRRFAGAADTVVNRARREVLAACREAASEAPGAFSLCVPTGGGKTLSAIAFALAHAEKHGLRRVIVVLPYTSIIEQNAAVYAEALGPDNVLEHHGAWDEDRYLMRAAGLPHGLSLHRQKLLTENWDAPIIVTTSVQFLESLHANQPRRCRKLHRIAESVVIFDEIQTLPVGLLDATLDTLRCLVAGFRVSLVSCTATQPALGPRANRLTGLPAGYGLGDVQPIVRSPAPLFGALARVDTIWPNDPETPTSWEALAREVAELPRVLVIVHQRKDARELATRLDEDTFHLSALMLPAHRTQVIDRIKHRLATPGAPCRVVATQLVEAGVDIDFPVVYRALAGLDSLAQAAGRCNREGRLPGRGSFRVFIAPTEPPQGTLTRARDLTRRMMTQGHVDLNDPALYQRFYADLYDVSDTDKKNLLGLRQGHQSDFPKIAEDYRLIEDGYTLPVVVPWAELPQETLSAIDDLRRGFADEASFRRVRRATVNVRRQQVLAWVTSGIVRLPSQVPIPILDLATWPHFYHPRFGLDDTADSTLAADQLIL